jgi:hypothetical protein
MKIYDYFKTAEDMENGKIYATFTEEHDAERLRFESLSICTCCRVSEWPAAAAAADDHQDTDTTTAAEVISESEPTAAPAAGSMVAKVITRAALYLFRFVWFAVILVATFATLAGLCSVMADALPSFFLLRLVGFLVCAAAAVGVELLLIAGTRRIDRATDCRLFAMH